MFVIWEFIFDTLNVIFFQVEAALLTEPDNDELLKLKVDLQEIITLQEELTSSTTEQPSSTASDDTTKNPWKVRYFIQHLSFKI